MSPLAEVAALFIKLGFTAFGGPAAHIAIMHDEVVTGRKWLTAERLQVLLFYLSAKIRDIMPISPTYSKTIIIPKTVIDENGHVNNVVYVQWMQNIAVEHYSSIGGVEAQGPESTWVIREHKIEYFLPAFEGEKIEVRTWVENVRRVRSLRKYEFVRKSDGKVLVKGETDWVFVDVKTGAPKAVPDEVVKVFQIQ